MAGEDGFGPVMRGGPSATDVPAQASGAAQAPPERSGPPPPEGRRQPADDGFGPPVKGRASRLPTRSPGRRSAPETAPRVRRPRRRRGPVRVLLTALLILLLLVVGTGVAVAAYASARIERVDVGGLQPAPGMNVLVVGSDSREGLTDEEVRDLGTGRVAGSRTDTIFVLSTRGRNAAVLSFPRDLYVTRCDGSQGRINAAFNIGDGRTCLVETVSATSGLAITHYLEMNFLSFVNIVDALGGVEICLDEPIRDAAAAIDLPAGCSHLDGATALGFVRVRKIDDDLGRIARQQYFLQQLAREAARPSTVLNVPRLWSTAGAAGGSLIADEGFGPIDLLRLGLAARGMAGGTAATHVVPTTPQSVGGAAVLVPVEPEAQELYASFRDGSVLRATPQPEADGAGG